jgi:3-demethoxyubiquinol 3-hydroxylase
MNRQYSLIDNLCLNIDQVARALFNNPKNSSRPYPAENTHLNISAEQAKHSAGLMRVNHTGEICAQALYHGQSIASRNPSTREKLQQAAIEEGDHLAWCSQRLQELSSHTSYLNPFWYLGSFLIGLTAGFAGDRWSLGFVAETENQVIEHLQNHLEQLPEADIKSQQILQQMETDEAKHRHEAMALGAAPLPLFIKKSMKLVSKLMVKTAYWI